MSRETHITLASRWARIAPGLSALLGYRRADLPHDLIAGLSVAAVALPVGVAYAQLILAGRMTETKELREARHLGESSIVSRYFPTLRQAVRAYRALEKPADVAPKNAGGAT